MHAPWDLDPTRILTRRELATVLADAVSARKSANAQRNRIIVRLLLRPARFGDC